MYTNIGCLPISQLITDFCRVYGAKGNVDPALGHYRQLVVLFKQQYVMLLVIVFKLLSVFVICRLFVYHTLGGVGGWVPCRLLAQCLLSCKVFCLFFHLCLAM